jgi:hypothetical protein
MNFTPFAQSEYNLDRRPNRARPRFSQRESV